MFKKEYKVIKKEYKEQLNKLNKNCIKNKLFGLKYFVTYLEFLRDSAMLLSNDIFLEKDSALLASLNTAIAEYYASEECKLKYSLLKKLDTDETSMKIQQAYTAEVQAHLLTFYSIVCSNFSV